MGKVNKRRRRRVPEVLWRLFHCKARTLADTVLTLLSSPPVAVADCRCKGRRCLVCSGDKARSFLLRPKDPADYRKLLNRCFVVVPDQAPLFTAFDPHNRWSQLETVKRNIEMMTYEQPASSNVLCSGYNKSSRLSSIVEHLTSSAWCLLLRRVGDNLMAYLLRNTLIFLPLPHGKYHQVAGFPISDLCKEFSKGSITFKNHPSKFHHGSGKKRKRVDGGDLVIENLQSDSAFRTDFSSTPSSCVGCSVRYECTPSSSCCQPKFAKKSIIHGTALAAKPQYYSTEVSSLKDHQESSTQTFISKKRVRKYSWQRRRKRRNMCSQESSSFIHCTGCPSNKDNSYVSLQCGFNSDSGLQSQEGRCSCCLVLQTLPKVIRKAQIDRQSIFYKLEKYPSIFPKKHILNALEPNYSGANALFRDIFGSAYVHFTDPSVHCLHSTKSCFIKSTCLYHSLIKQLKILIRKVRGCQLLRLLDKHCGASSLDQDTNTVATAMLEGSEHEGYIHKKNGILHASDTPSELIGADSESCRRIPKAHDHQLSKGYCLKKQVVSFLWAVCRSIVPRDLLGSPYNWRILRKNISIFVRLRRFEKFSLKQCTHNLKISKFPLLSNRHSLCYISNSDSRHSKRGNTLMMQNFNMLNAADAVRHKVLQYWILWFFSCLVVPLMQANFYVTESENGKQELCYYRMAVWQKLTDQALVSLEDCSYSELTGASVRRIIRNRSFGFSRIRFRSRDRGFRALANLRAPSRIPVKSFSTHPSATSSKMSFSTRNVKYNYYKSVNNVLQGVHVVLKGIQLEEPEKLGSSVFDYTDVYSKFVPFLHLLKGGSSTVPGVFIIVADVSKAFDSIDQNKLLNVMEDVISHDEYPLTRSLQVGCTRKSFIVRQPLMLPHQDHTYVPISTRHGVLVKEELSTMMKKVEIFSHLNEHIKHNVLQFDRKFYLQRVGISQGCVLSSLLCSFYYGHLEKNVIFPFLEKAGELPSEDSVDEQTPKIHPESETVMGSCKYLLLRFIDDYLFISTSKKQASLFFSRLQRGFRGYSCYMNERKFGVNFDMDRVSGFESNRFYMGADRMSFLRWSGLLVNCCTLEIQADYTRYLDCHLSTSLTISWNDHPARLLKSKLFDYLRPKCHPIFYDTNINSAAVIRLNIYQAFLLCAMKFNCYIRNFSSISAFSTECCMDAIETSLRYMHKLIKRRMQALLTSTGFGPIFKVGKDETKWLGLNAFVRALSRKQSRYRELLSMLRSELKAKGETGTSSALKYAVDDAHSSVLWKIKY